MYVFCWQNSLACVGKWMDNIHSFCVFLCGHTTRLKWKESGPRISVQSRRQPSTSMCNIIKVCGVIDGSGFSDAVGFESSGASDTKSTLAQIKWIHDSVMDK